MIRGRSAERAVEAAATHYRKAGKADVRKQATGMRRAGGTWVHSRKAAIDYRGTIAGGKSYCCEVKQHSGVSFPLSESTLPAHQRDALDTAVKMGGDVWMVFDLPDVGESYAIEWRTIQAFLTAPYRHSLSLQYLRAHGFICKASGRGTDKFAIWFLDVVPHEGRAAAFLAEAAERAKSPIVDLEKPVEGNEAPAVHQTPEQYRARVRAAIAAFKPKKKTGGWY